MLMSLLICIKYVDRTEVDVPWTGVLYSAGERIEGRGFVDLGTV